MKNEGKIHKNESEKMTKVLKSLQNCVHCQTKIYQWQT